MKQKKWLKPEYCPFKEKECADCEYLNKQTKMGCHFYQTKIKQQTDNKQTKKENKKC